MEINEIKEKTKDLTEHVSDYAETFYKLAILKMTRKGTDIASAGIMMAAIAIFGLFITFFAGVALALWLGDLLANRALGFLLVSGFFLLIMVIIIALRKKMVFPYFRNLIIRKFYV